MEKRPHLPFRAVLAAALALFLLLSPRFLIERARKEPYLRSFQKPAPDWYGVIELWHIASFKPYQGSVTRYLEERANDYCKRRPGVHIEVIGMTEGQYAARVARGLTPHAYSFSSGFLYLEQLRPIEGAFSGLLPGLPLARKGRELYAVPYLMSGYALLVNMQKLYALGLTLPKAFDPDALRTAMALPGKPQVYAPAVLAAQLGLSGTLATREAFLAGDALYGLTDLRDAGNVARGLYEGVVAESVPFCAYTDQVLYLGAAKGTDDRRAAILADFIQTLLTESEQLRLTAVGCMPVVAGVQPVFTEKALTAWYAGASEVLAPDPFLLERHGTALVEEGTAAVTGDLSAKKSFSERMAVVLDDPFWYDKMYGNKD